MAQDVIHPDHIILPRLVENGIFYARLNQWDQYPNPGLRALNDLPPHMPNRLFFSVGRAPVNQLQISFIVDTTETINSKIDLLKCYASQMGESMKKNPTGWADKYLSRDAYWGEHIDTKYGEPFLSRRMIGIDDPITAILPVRYG